MYDIFIVSPHVCLVPQENDPDCDPNTDIYARLLKDRMKNSKLFRNKYLRNVCDINRSSCKFYPMRLKLRWHMNKSIKEHNPFILLDVHSFYSGANYNLNFNPDIVLLVREQSYLLNLIEYEFKKNNVSFKVLNASAKNDIIVEATQKGGQAILFEFRTDLKKNMIDKIIKSIGDAIDIIQKLNSKPIFSRKKNTK